MTLTSSSSTSFGTNGRALAGAPHIVPIAAAVLAQRETQHGVGDGDLARLDAAPQQRADIEPGLDRLRLEQGLIEASVLVGDLHIVEAELRRRQEHQMHLAADLDVAAEQLRGLRLEHRPVVVPVDKERRREERAEHDDQYCR